MTRQPRAGGVNPTHGSVKIGILIVGHGSRDAVVNTEFEALVTEDREVRPGYEIARAYVELARPALPEGLAALARRCREVVVLPLFLFAAGPVKNDSPWPSPRPGGLSRSATGSILKDAGDDPDCTHGAEIVAEVELPETPGIEIRGGPGVATVTKPGLGVGTAAINPVPSRNITEMVEEELSGSPYRGARVTIAVPGGENMAKKATNARLGLLGGISILGATGIVKPYSTAAWRASVVQEIDVAMAAGKRRYSPPAASPSNTRWRSTPSCPRRPSSRWGVSSASGCDTVRDTRPSAPSWSG